MTDISSKRFFYCEVEGGAKTRSINIPSNGYFEAIAHHFSELEGGNAEFNYARVLSSEVISYCIQCIEKEHSDPSSKASMLFALFSTIEGADSRFRLENLKTAIDFLLKNEKPIGEGIVSDTAITSEKTAELNVGKRILDFIIFLTCSSSQNRGSASDLLRVYDSYFEQFFQKNHSENDFSQSQLISAKKMLRIHSTLAIEIPDYLKDIRSEVLNGFVKGAFNIVSNPNSETGRATHSLIVELVNPYFKIILNPDDPIACVQDGEGTLLRAKDDKGGLVYLFHLKTFSISAQTEDELRDRVSGVSTMSIKQPAEILKTLLPMMPA
jgi:hypothetical protein